MNVARQGRWLRALGATAALVAAALAGIVPASAQDEAEPGYCGPVVALMNHWLPEPTTNEQYATQAAEGQAIYDAAYASVGTAEPESGLLQQGLYVFPGLTNALAADVAAAGGNYLDVPAESRAEHRTKIIEFMNGLSDIIAPYCAATPSIPPTGALVGPCDFGPVALPSLLGVSTRGATVEAAVGDQVYVLGSAADPSTAPELVFVEVDEGVAAGEVLLNGQVGPVTRIPCSTVAGPLVGLGDYPALLSAAFTPGCASPAKAAALKLAPNQSLSEAVGIRDIYGGVGAPFALTVEVDGDQQVVPMPVGSRLELDAGASAPTVTVNGQAVEVTTLPAECGDAPSSQDDAPSSEDDAPSSQDDGPGAAAPLSPKFTG
ncbi:MAG: hypothetical protein R2754_17585 [Microthrixaceae bacterium]